MTFWFTILSTCFTFTIAIAAIIWFVLTKWGNRIKSKRQFKPFGLSVLAVFLLSIALCATVLRPVFEVVGKLNELAQEQTEFLVDDLRNNISVDEDGTEEFETDSLPLDHVIFQNTSGNPVSAIQVDFSGDDLKDYIVVTKNADTGYSEKWFLNNGELFWEQKPHEEEIFFRRFQNLDDDPELEVYVAAGYEDGIDCYIQNIHLANSELETCFYFKPAILKEGKAYYGYPWECDTIVARMYNGKMGIHSALEMGIHVDGVSVMDEKQKNMPVLFFDAELTNQVEATRLIELDIRSLESLKEFAFDL